MNETTTQTIINKALGGMPFKPEGAYLAGGAINSVVTGREIKDFDIYFKSREAFEKAVREAYEEPLWCVSVTSRAITFALGGDIMQFMCMGWFETAAEIFKAFDFTAVMAAIDLDTNELITDERFWLDSASRKLSFNPGTRYPVASGVRVGKYVKRGYTITEAEALKVYVACAFAEPPKNWDELQEMIGGHYGQAVLSSKPEPFTREAAFASIGNIIIGGAQDNIPDNAEAVIAAIFNQSTTPNDDTPKPTGTLRPSLSASGTQAERGRYCANRRRQVKRLCWPLQCLRRTLAPRPARRF